MTETPKGRSVAEDATEPEENGTKENSAKENSTKENSTAPAAPAARAKKKVRRVRVIEVIDDEDDGEDETGDEDLKEVLQALDDEDEEDEEDAAAGVEEEPEKEKPVSTKKPPPRKPAPEKPKEKAADKPEKKAADKAVEQDEPEESEEEPEEEPAAPRTTRVGQVAGSPRLTTVLVVVLIAALATVAIWQWRTAAGLSSKEDDRREVAKVAGQFGDVVLSYNASSVKSSIDRNLALMGGDLHTQYASNSKNLPEVFTKNPQFSMSSKIKRVYVASVDGSVATVVVSMDVKVQSPEGGLDYPETLLRLAMSKIDGKWKVTQYKASGQSDQQSGTGNLPGLPGQSPSAKPTKKEDKGEKNN